MSFSEFKQPCIKNDLVTVDRCSSCTAVTANDARSLKLDAIQTTITQLSLFWKLLLSQNQGQHPQNSSFWQILESLHHLLVILVFDIMRIIYQESVLIFTVLKLDEQMAIK